MKWFFSILSQIPCVKILEHLCHFDKNGNLFYFFDDQSEVIRFSQSVGHLY